MTQFAIGADGVRIAFDSIGAGEPVVLVHGFASNRVQNWQSPGWYEALARTGHRIIAMDCRGHGESGRPYDPAAYAQELMAQDVAAVMKAAGVAEAALFGYSMGAQIGIEMLLRTPGRVRKLVIGGVGARYLTGGLGPREAIAAALEAPSREEISDPVPRMFRDFAGQKGKDLRALAACMRGRRAAFSAAELSRATQPVLVVCGEQDSISGPPGPLAAAFPNGTAVTIPRRDHMSAVGDKATKRAVLDFLAG